MCFMNCPYENHLGECTVSKNIPIDAYCREDFEDFPEVDLLDDDFDSDQSGKIFLDKGKIVNTITWKR